MKKMKIFAVALGLLVAIVAVQPANAACDNARSIVSLGGGLTSYVIAVPVGTGVNGTSVTAAFAGTWWALGEGDAASPGGVDSGTFPGAEWLYTYPNYPVSILTGWNADNRIDGCIDATTSTCTAMQLTDVNEEGTPVFAILSSEQDEFKNYSFIQAGGAPINLAATPAPEIVGSTAVGETGVILDIAALDSGDFDAGLYLDPACGAGGGGTGLETLVPGVCWYSATVARGADAPDTNIANWNPTGVCTDFGAPASLNIPCAGEQDVFTTYALTNESGIPVENTSGATTRSECGSNFADPEQRIRVKPTNRKPNDRTKR